MEIEERVKLVEDAILLMKDLLLSHNGRLDDYHKAFRESREDFDFKMNALIDAQMKNESDLAILKESTTKLQESTSDLRDASRSQLARIEKLENI